MNLDDFATAPEPDREQVAQRVSEARVELVLLLSDKGFSAERVADLVNKHFDELCVLAVALHQWSPSVLAQAMLARVSRDDAR